MGNITVGKTVKTVATIVQFYFCQLQERQWPASLKSKHSCWSSARNSMWLFTKSQYYWYGVQSGL